MKLKERISIILKSIFNILKKFPVTLTLIFLCTLFFASFLDTEVFSNKTLIHVLLFFIPLILGTFSSEIYFEKKKIKFIMLFVVLLISSLLLVFYNKSYGLSREYFYRVYIPYNIILGLFSLFVLYKKSELTIERYYIQICFNFFKLSIVYYVLSTGIMMLTSLFSFLILGKDAFDLIWRVMLIVVGFIYLPGIIVSLISKDEKIIGFVRIIVKYIMTSLLIIAFIIIYIYMLKIFILWQIPSNQIFRILATLFVLGLPIWTLCYNFKDENDLIDKINKKLPILFIPFIFLQVYSIGVRILENGFTIFRYLCIILLVFEVIYIVIYIFDKRKIYYMFMAFSALIIISTVVPGVNMFDVSYKSQTNRINNLLEKNELSNKEKAIIKSSYSYLSSYKSGEKFFEKRYTKEDQNRIEKYIDSEDLISHKELFFSGEIDDQIININGYNTLEKFDEYYSEDVANNTKKYVINGEKYNLSKLFKKYLNHNHNFEDYFNKNYEIVVDSNTKIIINYISFSYDSYNEEVEYCTIRGYILKK